MQTTHQTYTDFLKDKADFNEQYGFPVKRNEISPILKPHQKDIVQWAVAGGRRAIFASFGLGKSIMQLETLRLIMQREGGKALVICPLGVRIELAADARNLLGLDTKFVRKDEEVQGDGLYITNYESVRDGKLSVDQFTAVSLDEASILRSFGSKTYQTFLASFDNVKYKFVATATPSPNRCKELIHYAGFLGVMDTGQALTRFFQRDSTKANNLRLYPHKEREFYLWLSTWAAFVQSPADLGHDATGYDLPERHIHTHEVEIDLTDEKVDRDGQGAIFRNAALGLKEAGAEKRKSLPARVDKAMEIVEQHRTENPGDQIILWCDLNSEQDALEKACRKRGITYSSVHGGLTPEENEHRLLAWKNRETHALIGKPVMLGQGMNLQQCNTAVFVGLTFKFNDLVQAIHRIHRFGQTRPTHAHLIYANSETEVVRVIREKWHRHDDLAGTMTDIIKEHGLDPTSVVETLTRSLGIDRIEATGENWTYANNDTVEESHLIPDNSVDLIVTSIPFANHYEYTPSYNDFGHTDNNAHFWEQMDYLTPELLRILNPGRIYACHVKDRINFGNVTGAGIPTVSPFHAEAIDHGIKHGFDYMGMITVVTDVVRENNQTYRLGWSENCKDGTKMGVGSPEYILLFHKPQSNREKGYADVPVTKSKDEYTRAHWQVDAHAFWRSSGNRALTPDELAALPPEDMSRLFTKQTMENIYDYKSHIKIGEQLEGRGALPATFMSLAPGSWHPEVWHDINRMLTLNGEQFRRNVQMHVCLARDSRVLTRERGYVPIQEVKVGEHTLTHKGNWKPVLAVENTGVRPVVTVKAQGVPGLTLTPDHKLWARDPQDYARALDAAKNTEPGWVEAQNVQGCYLNLKPSPENNAIGDETLWWMVGRWIADGHFGAHGEAVYSIGPSKWDEFEQRAGRFAGNAPRTDTAAHQVVAVDRNRELRSILEKCGKGAENKQLPPESFTLAPELARALLDGYLAGDGHLIKERDTWQCTTVSRDLALGLGYLAFTAYGASASVFAGRPPRTHTIEGREVQAKQEWQVSFSDPAKSRWKKPFVLEDGLWKLARTVEPAGEAETWNLRVADDASFTAEGCIVKNCPLQIDIVDRLIERYSNPGELVYDPFGGLGTVPVRAVKMGRKGRGVELNPGYYLDAVKYLEAEERKAVMPTLFDLEGIA